MLKNACFSLLSLVQLVLNERALSTCLFNSKGSPLSIKMGRDIVLLMDTTLMRDTTLQAECTLEIPS